MNLPGSLVAAAVSALMLACTPAQDIADLRKLLALPAPTGAAADYVAHEWGTFTSMADTEGLVLEGLHHEEEALPDFVHDLTTIAETGCTQAKLAASYVTQKMETPVVYFHADQPLQVRVAVQFRQGLMTQFYPLPTAVFPRLDPTGPAPVDLRGHGWSSLTWDLDILPRGTAAPEIPSVAADDPWHFARQTSACCVRTRPRADSPAATEAEHYLFYRGLGRWQPPIDTVCERGGRVRLANRGPHPIPFCLALELGEQGGRAVVGAAVAGGGQQDFVFGPAEWIADREQFARRVGAEVLRALVAEGLFVDEARAMVATWSRSWFQSNGARIVYVLPRAVVDEVLPLMLDPQPTQLVRVLVGRHEFITPEAQDGVEQALRDAAADDGAVRTRGETALAGLDRFLEPHLRNVLRNGRNDAAKQAAAARLAALTR